jgi:hypothetical protein
MASRFVTSLPPWSTPYPPFDRCPPNRVKLITPRQPRHGRHGDGYPPRGRNPLIRRLGRCGPLTACRARLGEACSSRCRSVQQGATGWGTLDDSPQVGSRGQGREDTALRKRACGAGVERPRHAPTRRLSRATRAARSAGRFHRGNAHSASNAAARTRIN